MTRIDPDAVAIGQAVRGALRGAGLTLAEAASRSGIPLSTLSRRVNGTMPFTWPEMVRICEISDMEVDELARSAERAAQRLRREPVNV